MRDHRSNPHSSPRWRKSSYSNQDGGDCLEVADGLPGAVPVRDSKDPDAGTLVVSAPAWRAFITAIRAH